MSRSCEFALCTSSSLQFVRCFAIILLLVTVIQQKDIWSVRSHQTIDSRQWHMTVTVCVCIVHYISWSHPLVDQLKLMFVRLFYSPSLQFTLHEWDTILSIKMIVDSLDHVHRLLMRICRGKCCCCCGRCTLPLRSLHIIMVEIIWMNFARWIGHFMRFRLRRVHVSRSLGPEVEVAFSILWKFNWETRHVLHLIGVFSIVISSHFRCHINRSLSRIAWFVFNGLFRFVCVTNHFCAHIIQFSSIMCSNNEVKSNLLGDTGFFRSPICKSNGLCALPKS